MINMQLELERVAGRPSPEYAIVFELSLKNNAPSIVVLLDSRFELWQISDPSANAVRRVGELVLSTRTTACDENHQLKPRYEAGTESHFHLFWYPRADELQAVEDFRAGQSPTFQIQSHFLANSTWFDQNRTPRQEPPEWAFPRSGNGWPLIKAISDVEWLAALKRIGFKHHILDRLKWPAMPPAFSRAERHLADAWKNHHTADHDGTLLSCYKAFECLGFDLYGDDAVTRRKLVEQLLEGVEPQKIAAVEDLMKSLQGFFHLGRHDRSAPVTLTHLDSQLAVACATIVMSYLAPQHKPVE